MLRDKGVNMRRDYQSPKICGKQAVKISKNELNMIVKLFYTRLK